jgi:hypothetical protein
MERTGEKLASAHFSTVGFLNSGFVWLREGFGSESGGAAAFGAC